MNKDTPSIEHLTRQLIQKSQKIEPEESSGDLEKLLNEFKDAHRKHFTYFMEELIKQFGEMEAVPPSSDEELLARIRIYHFMLFELNTRLPYSVHTLTVDELISKALRQHIDKRLQNVKEEDPEYLRLQSLLTKTMTTKNDDIADVVNNITELEALPTLSAREICTDLIDLVNRMSAEEEIPESKIFINKYCDLFKQAEFVNEITNELMIQVDTLKQIDDSPLVKLESHFIAMMVLSFLLNKLYQKPVTDELRANLLLKLQLNAQSTLTQGIKTIRDLILPTGQHLNIISIIETAYKVINHFENELDTINESVLNNKASSFYSQSLIQLITNGLIAYFSDKIDNEILMAEYAANFESISAGKSHIQIACNYSNILKLKEKRIRELRLKPKKEVDAVYNNINWKTKEALKKLQSANNLAEQQTSLFNTIKTQHKSVIKGLEELKSQLQVLTDESSEQSVEAYTKLNNLVQELVQTTESLSHKNVVSQAPLWEKHLGVVFAMLQTLKQCQHYQETEKVLSSIIHLFDTICHQMSRDNYPVIIKASAEYLEIQKTLLIEIRNQLVKVKLAKTVEKTRNTENKKKSNNVPETVVVLEQKRLQEILDQLFSEEFNPTALSDGLKILLGQNSIARQIIDGTLRRVKEGMISIDDLATFDDDNIRYVLQENYQKLSLLTFLIETIKTKHSSLGTHKNNAVGVLYSLACLHFSISRKILINSSNHNENDFELFNKLEIAFDILEKFKPECEDYFTYLKETNQTTFLWPAHTSVLQYKICYAHICLQVNNFELAEKAIDNARDYLFRLNEEANNIALASGANRHTFGQELVKRYGTDLQSAAVTIKAWKQVAKPGWVTFQLDDVLYCQNPKEILAKIFNTLERVYPSKNNPVYIELQNNYRKKWEIYSFRQAILDELALYCDNLINQSNECSVKPPEEKIQAIYDLQKAINAIYFLIQDFAPLHDRRYPKDNETHRLQKAILVMSIIQAQLSWQLVCVDKIPFGINEELYELLSNNYTVFNNDIFSEYKCKLLTMKSDNPEYVALQLHALFEHALYFGGFAEQYADFEWVSTTISKAKEILAELDNLPQDNIDLSKCKIALEKANKPAPMQLQLLKQVYRTLKINIQSCKNHLDDLCLNQQLTLSRSSPEREDAETAFIKTIDGAKHNISMLLEALQQLNNNHGIQFIIKVLSTAKLHLLSHPKKVTEDMNGINNLCCEPIFNLIHSISNYIDHLDKELKRLEASEASRLKKEALQIQQKIKKAIQKSTHRAKAAGSTHATQADAAGETDEKAVAHEERSEFTKRSTAPSLVRKRQVKIKSPIYIVEDTKPEKISSKEKRQRKKFLQMKALSAKTETVQTSAQSSNIQESISENAPPNTPLLSSSQLKKRRRKERNELVQELGTSILQQLIEELTSLTLNQEKLSANDSAYLVPNVVVKIDPQLQIVLDFLTKNNIKGYCYGGYPRDQLLKRPHKDFDIVVFCQPSTLQHLFGREAIASEINPSQFSLHSNIDMRCTSSSLLEFADGLDTTANALFVDANGNLYDPKSGFSNLECSPELKTIGDTDQTFALDPVRMFRLMKQSMDLDKTIEIKDLMAIKRHAEKLSSISFNDFRKHFSSLFLNGKAEGQFKWLYKEQLLSFMLPVLKKANYSYLYIPFWLKMQCRRIDQDSNRLNNTPFYKLVAIFLAPHCHYLSKSTSLSHEATANNLVIDFLRHFQLTSRTKRNLFF